MIKTELYALIKFISDKTELITVFSVASNQVLKEYENDKNNSSN